MPEVMRQRRAELGLSQADLAAAAGVDKRQIRRYEAGQQQPALSVAVAMAEALEISLTELAGMAKPRIDLTGDLWTAWQSSDGRDSVTAQQVRLRQQGRHIDVASTTGGTDETGFHWRGELRMWDYEFLIGWYTRDDGADRSRGTLFFMLRSHADRIDGRWVSHDHAGRIATGWIAMAHTEDDARAIISKYTAEEALRQTPTTR
jgi:transcriptional regulator with XRE-family HTH domain